MRREDFIKKALKAAQAARDRGASIVPEIAAAQAALESRYGRSKLAREANNLFGIKAGTSWKGPVIEIPTREWDDVKGFIRVTARWRKYANWEECFRDYGNIINRLPWFEDAVKAARQNDALGFLEGILSKPNEPGWATDPKYRDKVLSVAESWGLLHPTVTSGTTPQRLVVSRFFLDGVEIEIEAASIVGHKLYVRTRRKEV